MPLSSEWTFRSFIYLPLYAASTLDFLVMMDSGQVDDAFEVDDVSIEALVITALAAPEPPAGVEQSVFLAPNPMRDRATLRLSTTRPGPLTARLFDLGGRCVKVLSDQRQAPAGTHTWSLDARDERGRVLPSGGYFYRVESADGSRHGRFVLMH